jgi:integrase
MDTPLETPLMSRHVANKPLSQRIIETTPRPKTGTIELRDHVVRGLVCRVFSTGVSFNLEYRSPRTSKMSRMPIDRSTLVEARAIALRHKQAIAEGQDPKLEAKAALNLQRAEDAAATSVRASLDAYEPAFLADAPLKQASRRDRMQRLRRVLTSLMERALSSIPQPEMIRLLDDVRTNNGPIAANRAHAEIRAWLGFAKLRGHATSNVLDRVSKEVSEKSRKRKRVLTDAELAAMVLATADGSTFSDYIRVLLHTAMRRNEAASLQVRDLDFEARTITVRAEVGKSGERVIPMAEALVPMLEGRADLPSPTDYLFGEGSGFRAPLQGWDKQTTKLRTAMPAAVERWTLHDVRRTVGTRLHMAKVHPLTIEDLLGHLSGIRGGVAGIYNVADTLDDQRLAIADWAASLSALAAPKVIPFPAAGRLRAIGQTR